MKRNDVHKAIILARGLGTRMRKSDASAQLDAKQSAAADAGMKGMIPIRRPFLDYILSALADAGFRRACLVVGPEHHEIRTYYAWLDPGRLEIEFATQQEPLGTADAVLAAETFADGDPFLMVNSDNYYPPQTCRLLRTGPAPAVALFDRDAMLAHSNIPAERIERFAIGEVAADGTLSRVIEKPDAAALAKFVTIQLSMNLWLFDATIFEACRRIEKSPRGEFEITSAVQYSIDHFGSRYHALLSNEPVLDLSFRSDVGPVTRKLEGLEVAL